MHADHITCPKCQGTGRKRLTKPYADCLNIIRRLGNPTVTEIYKQSGNGVGSTAINHRVTMLARWGLVQILDEKFPPRVRALNDPDHRPPT